MKNKKPLFSLNEEKFEFIEDKALDTITESHENGNSGEYKPEYILDHLARLFEGSSKCSAVHLSMIENEDFLLVSRNDIFEKSEKENTIAINHFEAIKKLFIDYATDSQIQPIILKSTLEVLLQNYETKRHCTLSFEQKNQIAHRAIEKLQKNDHVLLTKDDLQAFETRKERSEAASLFIAGLDFLRAISRVYSIIQNVNEVIGEKLKNCFKHNKIKLLMIDKKNIHSEMRILDIVLQLSLEKQNIGYIGISKLPCLECSSVIKLLNLFGYGIETRNNDGSGISFNVQKLPLFMKNDNKELLGSKMFNLLKTSDNNKIKAIIEFN